LCGYAEDDIDWIKCYTRMKWVGGDDQGIHGGMAIFALFQDDAQVLNKWRQKVKWAVGQSTFM